jgi:acyl-CoA thioesterase-1
MSFWTFSIAALALAGVSASVPAAAAGHRLDCQPSVDVVKLSRPLAKISERLLRNEDVTILALGSSSTYGTGASKSEFSYPSRLEQELHTLLPKAKVKVVNRGIGGEDAQQMLVRLDRDLANKPDLVLWQVGTNALLGETGIEKQAPLIRDGLKRIRASGADVVLMDPQYAPYVLRDPDARPMVQLLAKLGDEAGVPVFRRFALMQYWHETREYAFSDILAPDLFHMNDWSYGCLARNLAAALVANTQPAPAPVTVTTAAAPVEKTPAQATAEVIVPAKTASH